MEVGAGLILAPAFFVMAVLPDVLICRVKCGSVICAS